MGETVFDVLGHDIEYEFNSLGIKHAGGSLEEYKKHHKILTTKENDISTTFKISQEGKLIDWNFKIFSYAEAKDAFADRFMNSKMVGNSKVINNNLHIFLDFPSNFFNKNSSLEILSYFAPSKAGFSNRFLIKVGDYPNVDFQRVVEFNFEDLLKTKKFFLVICKNQRPEKIAEYSISFKDVLHEEEEVNTYKDLKEKHPNYNSKIHSLIILDAPEFDSELSEIDRLRVSWASSYVYFHNCCNLIIKTINDFSTLEYFFKLKIADTEDKRLKEALKEVKDILSTFLKLENAWEVPKKFHEMYENHETRIKLMRVFYGYSALQGGTLGQLNYFFNFYLFSEYFTNYGSKMSCLELTEPYNIETYEIDYDNLPKLEDIGSGLDSITSYWRIFFNSVISNNLFNGNMNFVLEPFDLGIPLEKYEDHFKDIRLSDSKEEVEELCISLLDEANASKNWVLNNGSYFAVDLGHFKAVQLFERFEDIHAKFITNEGFYYFINLNVELLKTTSDTGLKHIFGKERAEEIILALKQIICALVRDYWVVETKETVFEQKKISEYLPRKYDRKDKPYRVIYLPRVIYKNKKKNGTKECYQNLDYQKRSKHSVRAFLRSSKTISPLQKYLAQRYNFSVPEGYTFVQPHYRGETKKQQIIYRSRSAMQMIYNKDVSTSTNTNKFFQFEVDVKKLLEFNKFDVKHISANTRNDGGIDIVATKNLSDKQLVYLIQCKCYNKKLKIGPNIVRELAGSMAGYNEECRGIIITTSKFTNDAEIERKKLLEKFPIDFIDGEQFGKSFFKL